ncbi:diguanylate cyclase [Evansella sp. AB-rgal1]|uniref:diguanylate cyclase n=1 Tax=Evansella sp. AB-rgal1 TaxID=3242696 RepID=UPI00359E44AC
MNKLKNKILLVLVAILLVTIGSNNLVSGFFFSKEYSKSMEREMYLIGHDVKKQLERILSLGININDVFQFEEICKEVVEKYPEVSYAFVFDRNGKLLFHSNSKEIPQVEFNRDIFDTALENNLESPIDIVVGNKSYSAAIVPVLNDVNVERGAVIIAVPEDYISEKTDELFWYSVLQGVFFFAVSLLLLATILAYWVTNPLKKILLTMSDVRKGNLDARVTIQSKDEFGMLGDSLNQMLTKIRDLMQEQERANKLQIEYASEKERSRISELLRHAMYMISSTLDESKVQRLILEHLKQIVPYCRASLWMYKNGDIEWIISSEAKCMEEEVSESKIQTYIKQLKQDSHPIIVKQGDQKNNYTMVVPIYLHDSFVGMVLLERKEIDYSKSESEIALTYISQANIAIDNAIMYRKMEKMAVTDELTGLYNRRYFYRKAKEEFENAREFGDPFCLILFDVDYFKKINDQYGHFVGDEILRKFANIVKDTILSGHVLARFGGEEFVLLMAKTTVEEAIHFAENLRLTIANHLFETEKGKLQISLSIGVTESQEGDKVEDILHRTDEALYSAKEAGRNCVVVK